MSERTMLAFALADAQVPGRFGQVETVVVVGATPAPSYPAGGQRDPCPDEPPLGFDNPELEPGSSSPAQEPLESSVLAEAQAPPNPAPDAPSASSDVERRGAGSGSLSRRPYRRF